jgi:hypothetical protein
MLSNQQQALVQAIQKLDLDQVQSLLAEGLDPNFIDPEHGFPVSILGLEAILHSKSLFRK